MSILSAFEIDQDRADRLTNAHCTDSRCDGIAWDQLSTETCARCQQPVCYSCIRKLDGVPHHKACFVSEVAERRELAFEDSGQTEQEVFESQPDDYRNSEAR